MEPVNANAASRRPAGYDALKTYYIAEELARDPANAGLIPFVKKIREAHERAFAKLFHRRGSGTLQRVLRLVPVTNDDGYHAAPPPEPLRVGKSPPASLLG